MSNDNFSDYFSAMAGFSAGYGLIPTGHDKWRERLKAIRGRYAEYQRLVDAGHADWLHGDPYLIADWLNIFTPIEKAAWSDIRGLPFAVWPQFPVGKYVVDFAIVHKRIAIECDGAAYHDAERDAKRDSELNDSGWRVVRITGSDCWSDKCVEFIRGLA